MKLLAISHQLKLPIDAVTQKFAILGRTGSGKSYCATKLCEEMLLSAAQVIAIDPVGVWYGLRSGSDFSIPIFGGLHGDVPLEAGAGEFIANLIVDRGISAVLDVSQFLSGDQARFAYEFATRFFFRKKSNPSAVHLFIEECQEFVPQNVMGGSQGFEGKMLHAFERLIKLGRNFGIGASLISQRPQEVNKKALNQAECLLAFQMTGPQERKAIGTWIAEKGVNEDIRAILPHLKVGVCHVWSPQWLEINKTIKIDKKKTADVSSTPKAGAAKKVEPKPLSDTDLAGLAKQMAATIERAKATDPKELQKQIAALKVDNANLQRNAAKTPAPAPGKTEIKRVEVPLGKDLTRLEKALDKFSTIRSREIEHANTFPGQLSAIFGQLEKIADRFKVPVPTPAHVISRPQPAPAVRPAPSPRVVGSRAKESSAADEDSTLPPRRQKILNALAFFESIGQVDAARTHIAFFCDTSAASSTWERDLGGMRSAGLIEYPVAQRLKLTDEGRKLAQPAEPITLGQFHDKVYRLLPPRREKIARALIAIYPEVLDRPTLADQVGTSQESSTFERDLGGMRTAGIIDYPRHGYVSATDLVFPPLPA